jgi:hypothetical protein
MSSRSIDANSNNGPFSTAALAIKQVRAGTSVARCVSAMHAPMTISTRWTLQSRLSRASNTCRCRQPRPHVFGLIAANRRRPGWADKHRAIVVDDIDSRALLLVRAKQTNVGNPVQCCRSSAVSGRCCNASARRSSARSLQGCHRHTLRIFPARQTFSCQLLSRAVRHMPRSQDCHPMTVVIHRHLCSRISMGISLSPHHDDTSKCQCLDQRHGHTLGVGIVMSLTEGAVVAAK